MCDPPKISHRHVLCFPGWAYLLVLEAQSKLAMCLLQANCDQKPQT